MFSMRSVHISHDDKRVRVKRGTGIAESGMRNPELEVKRGIWDKTRN